MKILALHIEHLLRDNDCVILPGFGSFIACEVPAYYVREEGMYYPPSRNISFNASVTMNDGLLAQSYMKSYQVDYARAVYMVDMAVEQLIDALDEDGSVTLPRIGTISQNIYQAMSFTPDPIGVASPKHFGLGSFVVKEIGQLCKPADGHQEEKPLITQTAKTIDLHISKRVIHRVVSTAAIFLLLLMVALPTGEHKPTDVASLRLTEFMTTPQLQTVQTHSSVVIEPVMECVDTLTVAQLDEECVVVSSRTTPQAIVTEPTVTEPAIVTEPVAVVTESAVTITGTAQVENTAVETSPTCAETLPAKVYHVIVASLPNHRGADEMLNHYIKLGYDGASLVERDGRVRISLECFPSKAEADGFLKVLRQEERFQSAWLLAVKNN